MNGSPEGKRTFLDEAGHEWWAYQTETDPQVEGAGRLLTFYCPSEGLRETLPWPDGLAGLDHLEDAQLRALLPLGDELPERGSLRVAQRSEGIAGRPDRSAAN